ncbi:type II secretion system F family protein [Chthonobacter albigriseus]|uniref:type II secretion system F family protein n=1 Tax=Chthonobacter albigriseus TaxID=1683161 RepID=UPI001FCE41BD|nr:type II secretion system F family protein [Chthonobacter albigriseus]
MQLFGFDATILALVALVGFAVAGVAYSLLFNRINETASREKRLDRVSGTAAVASKKSNEPVSSRRRSVQDTLKDIETKQKFKASRSTNPPMVLRLQQAGIAASMSQFIIASVATGVVFVLAGLYMGFPFALTVGLGVVGGLGLPRFIVNYKRKKRQKNFIDELPNAVEVIVRGVKAGLPLNDCLRMIASEAKEPVRGEFKNITDALAIGIPLDEAVSRLFERMPLAEANFFAIVIAIQSKAGGNLSEALGNLARVLRDRKKMRAKIQAMSTEAKASAGIIGSLPIIVMGLVYITSPDYITILFVDPRGQVVLVGSGLVMAAGVFVMKRMINFDI